MFQLAGRVAVVTGGARGIGLAVADVADGLLAHGVNVVIDLLMHDPRSLPSRVEIRPSRPRK